MLLGKLKLWEQQCKTDAEKDSKEAMVKEEELKKKFLAFETASPTVANTLPTTSQTGSKRKHPGNDDEDEIGGKKKETGESSVSNMAGDKAKEWRSFWVPQLATTVSNKLEKPVIL